MDNLNRSTATAKIPPKSAKVKARYLLAAGFGLVVFGLFLRRQICDPSALPNTACAAVIHTGQMAMNFGFVLLFIGIIWLLCSAAAFVISELAKEKQPPPPQDGAAA